MPSFTAQVPNLQSVGPIVEARIAVNGHVEAILRKAGTGIPPPITIMAMIDTGATASVIRAGLPGQLGLNCVMIYVGYLNQFTLSV